MPSYTIPKTQTAAVVPSSGASIEIRHDHPVKSQEELAPGECLIKLACTGVLLNYFHFILFSSSSRISQVCHTDLHAALDDWPLSPKTPLVGGHEGVGEIVAIGNNTSHSPVKVGDRVGIKWLADSSVRMINLVNLLLIDDPISCLNCEQCRKGREQSRCFPLHCFYIAHVRADCLEAKLSGFTVDGTFQQYVVRVFHAFPSRYSTHAIPAGIIR